MLQNARATAFTVFELLRENKSWGRSNYPPRTQIRVNVYKRTPSGKIFCCKKLNYIKSSRPKVFRNTCKALFCRKATLKTLETSKEIIRRRVPLSVKLKADCSEQLFHTKMTQPILFSSRCPV